MNPNANVAVVGATGVVGRELLSCLAEVGHPGEHVLALASERSAGEDADYGDETLEVEQATAESMRGMELVFLATPPDVSRVLAARANAAGAWVIDFSSAFRLDPSVPLVHSAVNLELARSGQKGRIVCCPAGSTCVLVTLLEPLRRKFPLSRAWVTALAGVAAAGSRGIRELQEQTTSLLSGRETDTEVFPHRTAFNLIPQVGAFPEGGEWTLEELGWVADAGRIWGGGTGPRILGSAIQVPVFHGVYLAIELVMEADVTAAQVRETLHHAAGVKVLDTPSEGIYPMPMLNASDAAVHVGRVRVAPSTPRNCLLVAGADAARHAAANGLAIGLELTRPAQ